MKFGVREIANVVFKAKAPTKIGKTTFQAGQPVLYIDTATTSSMEGAATTVYAQGGRGNVRLMAWEGERTLTFTVEDALLSPAGFSILSGAGLFQDAKQYVHVHTTTSAYVDNAGEIDLTDALGIDSIDGQAPVFVMVQESDGGIAMNPKSADGSKDVNVVVTGLSVDDTGKKLTGAGEDYYGLPVFIDYYVVKPSSAVPELQIDAEHFGGYYYVEADTLFRRQADGVDMPATLTFPNVKIQSNFTFSMAATGDPSTFTFTMDAFPGYTTFDKTKKVLCVLQIVEDATAGTDVTKSVMPHLTGFVIDENKNDSIAGDGNDEAGGDKYKYHESYKTMNLAGGYQVAAHGLTAEKDS